MVYLMNREVKEMEAENTNELDNMNLSDGVQEASSSSSEESEPKTFTQNELNNLVIERLKRERSKYKNFEEIKEKAAKLDEVQNTIKETEERISQLEKEIAEFKKADEIRSMKKAISEKTGVPVSLLTGETEESCTEQAKAIQEFISLSVNQTSRNMFPPIKDAGEVTFNNGIQAPRSVAEQLQDFLCKQLSSNMNKSKGGWVNFSDY